MLFVAGTIKNAIANQSRCISANGAMYKLQLHTKKSRWRLCCDLASCGPLKNDAKAFSVLLVPALHQSSRGLPRVHLQVPRSRSPPEVREERGRCRNRLERAGEMPKGKGGKKNEPTDASSLADDFSSKASVADSISTEPQLSACPFLWTESLFLTFARPARPRALCYGRAGASMACWRRVTNSCHSQNEFSLVMSLLCAFCSVPHCVCGVWPAGDPGACAWREVW